MITFRDVSVRYDGATRPALHAVSIAAARGRLTAVVGPNGSGKSTLVRALIGRQPLAGGEIRIDDVPVASMERIVVARRIAVVPQETHPAFDYSSMEMVLMGRHPHLGLFQLEGPADIEIQRVATLEEAGPGDIVAAHTRDESVEVAQLERAVYFYLALMRARLEAP